MAFPLSKVDLLYGSAAWQRRPTRRRRQTRAPGAPDDPERLRRLIRESLKQLILRYDDRYLGGRGQCGRWNLNNPSELAEAAHEVALDFGYMSPDSTVRSLKGLLRYMNKTLVDFPKWDDDRTLHFLSQFF